MRIAYSRHYDIGFFGLERLHPFDSRKYSRAWRSLRREFGRKLTKLHVRPTSPVSHAELLRVHTEEYLQQLRTPAYVAQALELPLVSRLPRFLIDACILRPMRWGTRGSMLAAAEAMTHGLAVNLSGGYHHAKPDRGEGFCIYSDIGLAIHQLRDEGALSEQGRVAYIDLDAHMGNGVAHVFLHDPRVFILDLYNHRIYPWYDSETRNRIDCALQVHAGHSSGEYLQLLRGALPGFLDSIGGSQPVELAVYNAGTDVYAGDALGNLQVTAADALERDLYVIDQLRSRNIPTVMLLSGGYSRESYRLVAASVAALIRRYGCDAAGGAA